MAINHWRTLWTHAPRFGIYTFNWNIINKRSYITIEACEAQLNVENPTKFVGGARPVLAGSIAPQNGFVQFTMWWTLIDVSYLNIWVDITVFDPNDPQGMG